LPPYAPFFKLFSDNNLVILNLLLFLQLFGVVVVVSLKKIALIIENNSQIGGNQNGKQLLNSHQKVPYLITL
jgi:hypothetical protein